MKKAVIYVTVFAVVFVLTYLALCYMVPGLRIKLDADAFTYFIRSIQSMMFFKSLIAAAAGAVVCTAAALVSRLWR